MDAPGMAGDSREDGEEETAYLLSSEAMRQRLLEALQRTEGIPLDEVTAKLGL